MKAVQTLAKLLLLLVLLSVSVAPAAGRHHHRGTKKRRMQKMLKMKKNTSVTTSRKGTKLTASSVKGATGKGAKKGTIVVGSKGIGGKGNGGKGNGGKGGSKAGFNAPFPAPVVLLPLIPTLAPSMEEPSRQPVTRIPTRTPPSGGGSGGGGGGAAAAPTVCLSTPCQTTTPQFVPCGVGGVAFFSPLATRTLTAAGQTLSFDFIGLPAPIAGTTVFIGASYTGDIVNANQCMELQGEDGPTSSGFCKLTSTTTATTANAFTTATAAEFNAWNADGTVTIQQDASSFVTPIGTDVGSVLLAYCTLQSCGLASVTTPCPNQPATPVDCTAFPGTTSVTTPTLTATLTTSGQALAFSFTTLVDAISPVNIIASYNGDTDESTPFDECLDIVAEGGVFSGSCYFDETTTGTTNPTQVVTQATAAEFNAWNADGTVTITLDADSGVGPGDGGGNDGGTVQLQYCARGCGTPGVTSTCQNQPATPVDCAAFPGTASVTTPTLTTTLTTSGEALAFSFAGLSDTVSPVNIIASYNGDTDDSTSSDECLDIVAEGGVFSGSCYFDETTTGTTNPTNVVTQATAAEFNAWNVDGTVTITLDADSGVDPNNGGGNDVGSVQLQYCARACGIPGILAACPNQPATPVDCAAFPGTTSVTTPILTATLTTSGEALAFSFAGLSDSVSPVNIIASYNGDTDDSTTSDECLDIVAEGGVFSGSCYFDETTTGTTNPTNVVTQATAAEFNAWNVDGTVTITLDADSGVDPNNGGGNDVGSVQLQYCARACGIPGILAACPNQPATPVDCAAFPGTTSVTTPILTATLTTSGEALAFSFAGLSDSVSPVNIIASYNGDTDDSTTSDECLDIVAEGGVFSGSCYFDETTTGTTNPTNVVTQATAAEFNAWNVDGTVTITLDADSGVDPNNGGGNDVGSVQLQYCARACGIPGILAACPNQPATPVDCAAFPGTTSVTTPILTATLTTSGEALAFSFAGLSDSVSPVNIIASYNGDTDDSTTSDECLDIVAEGGVFSGSCYFDETTTGTTNPTNVVTQATAAEFNAWNADGTVTITLDADSGVDPGNGGGNDGGSVQLQYCARTCGTPGITTACQNQPATPVDCAAFPGSISTTSTILTTTLTTSGEALAFSFAGLADSLSPVNILATFDGDIDSGAVSNECFDIVGEGGVLFSGSCYFDELTFGATGVTQVVTQATAAEFNGWNADGTVTIILDADSNVLPGVDSSVGTIQLQYCITPTTGTCDTPGITTACPNQPATPVDCSAFPGTISTLSTVQTATLTTSGEALVLSFTGLADSVSPVNILASFDGDDDQGVARNECIDILSEFGVFTGSCYFNEETFGAAGNVQVVTQATAADFNAWNADGTVTLTLDADSNINPGGGSSVATIQLQYCIIEPPATCGTPGITTACPNQPATPVDCAAFPGSISTTSTVQTATLTTSGEALALSFAGLADSVSPVNILASFDGDDNSGAASNECIDILSEFGVFTGSCYFDELTFGATGNVQVVTQATAADFNTWNADGFVTITLDADRIVDPRGDSNVASVRLQYCIIPPPQTCGTPGITTACPNQPATPVDCTAFPGTISTTTTVQTATLTTGGEALALSFTGLADSVSPVNILASYDGDIDRGVARSECMDILSEFGVFTGSCYFDELTFGAAGNVQVVTQATAADFNAWNADGMVTITLDADSNVLPGVDSSVGTIQLQYCIVPPPATCGSPGITAVCPNQPATPVDCAAFPGSISTTSTILTTTLTTSGEALSLSFNGLVDSVSPVNILASYDGDIDGGAAGANECIDILSEFGVFTGSCYFDGLTYGAAGNVQVVTQATAADFNAWNADGFVTITLDADRNVDPSGGGSNVGTIQLQYCIIPPPQTCGTPGITSACPNQPATAVDCSTFPGSISTTSTILTATLTTSGQALVFSFTGLADSVSPVNILASYDGDDDQGAARNECIDILSEFGVFTGSCYFDELTFGATGNVQVVTQAAAADFNAWNADGMVTLILDADSNINPGGGSSIGTIQLQYCILPPPATCGTPGITTACPNQPATPVDCAAFPGSISTTSTILTTTLTTSGEALSLSFNGLVNSVSPVNILASYDGDIDSGAAGANECMDVLSEFGVFTGSCYFDGLTYGAAGIPQVVTQATAADFNAWNADGAVTITLDADRGVGTGGAFSKVATVQLQYCIIPPPQTCGTPGITSACPNQPATPLDCSTFPGSISTTSTILTATLTTSGQALAFSFTGLVDSVSPVNILASYDGDIDRGVARSECMDILSEFGVFTGSCYFDELTFGAAGNVQVVTQATAADFNAWNADGMVTITLDADSNVLPGVDSSVGTIQLQYCILPPPATCGTPGIATACPNQPATPVDCTAFPGTTSVTTTVQSATLTTSGEALAFSFPGLVDSVSPVNILASYDGDIDGGAAGANECMDILSEFGVFTGSCYFDKLTFGATGIPQVVTQATAADFNAWNADGTVTLTLDADRNVGAGGAFSNVGTIQLQYCV
ncbi:unnamed protein product [Cylindrotheca closterium]|uniref:Calmodulin n=1 Tax=Cylindrotheca closterium TaxID=2856 RepID=A0AAD2CS69_9STRA|nr:unnamed protein product [Cylindrotheca closterium]